MSFARGTVMTAGLVGAIYTWFLFRGLSSELEVLTGGHPLYLSVLMVALSTLLVATVFGAGMRVPVWPWLAIASALVFLALVFLGQLAVMQAAARAAEPGVGIPPSFVIGEIARTRGSLSLAVTVLVPLLLLMSAVSGLMLSPRFSSRSSELREA